MLHGVVNLDTSECQMSCDGPLDENSMLHRTSLPCYDAALAIATRRAFRTARPIITTDVEGRVTFQNPVAESLTGWTQEALRRPLADVVCIVNEESRQRSRSPPSKQCGTGIENSRSVYLIVLGPRCRRFRSSRLRRYVTSNPVVGCKCNWRRDLNF